MKNILHKEFLNFSLFNNTFCFSLTMLTRSISIFIFKINFINFNQQQIFVNKLFYVFNKS